MRFILPVMMLGFVVCGCSRTPTGIAVIDIESIFKNYKKSQSIYEGLEQDRRNLETRGQEMLDEINKLVKESELLSDETRKEREARIREKGAALEAFRRGAAQDLADRTSAEYQKLMGDVRAAAEAVAKRRQIEIVLDASVVVYGTKGLDVTEEVIGELNRRFDKESGRNEARPAAPAASPTAK
jgi:Skp family chaperone for outer membrane proteins